MLGIRKERIDPGEPWQNYAETLLYVMWNLENSHITYIMWTTSAFLLKSFQRMAGVFHIIGVQRRLADWSFEKAQTWEDLLAVHEKWLIDYNHQRHMNVVAEYSFFFHPAFRPSLFSCSSRSRQS